MRLRSFLTGASYLSGTRHTLLREVITTEDFYETCRLLPAKLRADLKNYCTAEEIRLRCGYKPSVLMAGKEIVFSDKIISEEDLLHVIDVASAASMYASAEFISSGFISYKGIRIGLCGQAVYSNSQLSGFKNFSSVAIRIPHQLKECIPKEIHDELLSQPTNLLVTAGPGVGKTTALRELVYSFSENGWQISLLDERGEFGEGDRKRLLGRCTDVLSFVPKAKAATIMLRAMNPQIIAMDEISKAEDIDSVLNIIGCGTYVFATAHAWGINDMLKRPIYKKLVEESVFEKILIISVEGGKRKYSLERLSV